MSTDDIEIWFIRRGVPHFIEDYSATQDVFTRALPALSLVFLFEMFGALNFDWPLWVNALALPAGFGALIGAWMMVNRARGRRPLQLPDDLGPVELATFVLVPALLHPCQADHVAGELSAKRTTVLPLARAGDLAGWLLLLGSGVALCAFLWNHRQFDLEIYLDAVRGWPRHSLYDYRDPKVGLPFNYPPFAAVLFLPLRALDRAVVAKLWLVAVVGASAWFIVMATRMAPRFPSASRAAPIVAAVGVWSVPVLLTARLGQINWLLALAVLLDVKWEREGARFAGLGTGFAAAIKLYPAAAVLYFVARRNWKAVRNAATTAGALSLVATAVMPRESVDYWTKQIFAIDRLFGADNPLSTSMRREIAWLPLPEGLTTLLWLVAATALGWIAFRRIQLAVEEGNALAGVTIAMCAGSACFPLTWSHHLYFLLPAVPLWFGDGRSVRRYIGAAALCVVLFEGLHPGRNATLIVARTIALVVVTAALPIESR